MTDPMTTETAEMFMRQRDEALAERDRYADALREIADDVGHPGDPSWRVAMEALGLDVDGAIEAWHD